MKNLTTSQAERILQMLRSGDKEFCNLAATLFESLTNHYEDYYDIRTMYDPRRIFVENIYAKGAFNRMFNCIDTNTIYVARGKNIQDYRKTSITVKQKKALWKRGIHWKES